MMAVLLLTTRGTPQMYYGEELGMRTTDPARIEDVHDPIGKLGWPRRKGVMVSALRCSGIRPPMPGSRRQPPLGCRFRRVPPPTTSRPKPKDPDSILNAYKRLLALRKSNPALRDGSYKAVNEDDPDVFSFVRKSGTSTVLVALNMSSQSKTVSFQPGVRGSGATLLFSSPRLTAKNLKLDSVTLAPFGAVVASVN